MSSSSDDMSSMSELRTWTLPPLILHPFSTPEDTSTLLDATKANLMQHKLIPSTGMGEEKIADSILRGRYCEMRWLYFIGRDVVRWIDQCLDFVQSHEDLKQPQLNYQSFAAFLTENPPASAQEKLKKWGVFDYRRVFSRALGLNAIFAEFPNARLMTEEFIREYFSYSDHLFACRQKSSAYLALDSQQLKFDIYTSGEYMRILESGFKGN